MTYLLRSRGATSEMARLFAAEADSNLNWQESIWPGEQVPVILEEDGKRRLTTMAQGLAANAFVTSVPARQRGAIYPRDLCREGGRLLDSGSMSRCLIVIESFAHPSGIKGECTRNWFGLWDHSLVARAGVYRDDRCAGVQGVANTLVEPLGSIMPRLLRHEDHASWLAGNTLLSLGSPYEDEAFFCENLGERWSTGRMTEAPELGLPFAA